jgi:tetratricopeptide (TPR) repeat protein
MKAIRTNTVLVLMAVWIAAAALAGCASSGTKDTAVRDEYKRMLDMQKNIEAATAAGATLKELPEMDARGLEQAGDNYVRQGNPAMAFVQYEKALTKDPKLQSARYKKGLLLLSRGMNEEALKTFDEILAQDPQNALALEGRGRARMAAGDIDGAMESYDRALAADPKLWQVHALRGVVHDQKRNYEAAIAEYEKAIAINAKSSLLFNNLGMSFYLKDDYQKAIDAYIKAVRIDSSNRRVFNNMGLALFKLGRYDDALLAFKHGGDEAAAYNNMGCLYMADRKYAEAKKAFEKAIGMKPNYFAKAHENLKKAESALAVSPNIQ